MDTSEALDVSAQIDEIETSSDDVTDNGGKKQQQQQTTSTKHSTPSNSRKNSSARRKHAVVHRTPSSPTIEEVNVAQSTATTDNSTTIDGNNEHIQYINNLVENTSINDDFCDGNEDNNNTSRNGSSSSETTPSSPCGIIPTCIVVSDDDGCNTIDDEQHQRKNSNESEISTASSSVSSSTTLKTPASPSMLSAQTPQQQSFRRGGKLRGSAGPVFKSIFHKNNNNNSTKIQKTVSMDALNVSSGSSNTTDEKHRKRSLSKKQRNKELHKSATVIAQHTKAESGYPMVKSLSSCAISNDKDSSTETISSKSSASLRGDGSTTYIENSSGVESSERFIKSKSERKSKIFKTLKSFVGKK